MIKKAHKRYCAINEACETDEEYLALQQRIHQLEPQFRAVMNTLPPQKQETIMEMIGLSGELSSRMVEIACFLP